MFKLWILSTAGFGHMVTLPRSIGRENITIQTENKSVYIFTQRHEGQKWNEYIFFRSKLTVILNTRVK